MPVLLLTDRSVAGFKPGPRRVDYFDRAFPGFGVRVSTIGRKTFQVFFRSAGSPRLRRMTLGTYGTEPPHLTLAQARERARREIRKATQGRDPIVERQDAREQTFDALAALYLERHAQRLKRSWREDARRIRKALSPAWGPRPVTSIRRADVRDLLDRIIDRGTPVEANRTLALIRKMLNFALDREWVEANVAAKMARPGGTDPARARVLTPDELRTLWPWLHRPSDPESAPADARSDQLNRAALTMRLVTAQRGKEVVNLRWPDVSGSWWTIPDVFTKNKKPHRVWLTKSARDVLAALRAEAPADQVFAFTGIRGTRQRRGALDGLSLQDVRPHDFRRTASSMMTAARIPRLVVSKVLNHISADASVTGTHYDLYAYDREKRHALETWAKTLREIVTPKKSRAAKARRRSRRRV